MGVARMVHVRDMAIKMGINYIAIPPHSQSLNEAERIADRLWACARIQQISTGALDCHFAYGMDFACYVKLRMATTAHRDWLTPYEILRGSQPSIAHLQPFWTKAFVQVPKTKRAKMKEWGQPHQRAEVGHLIGYQDPWGSTARVLLDRNRVVHSRNVTYDSKSVTNPTPAPTVDRGEDQSVAHRDGIEEIIDGFAAMDITEHSLVREGASITQGGAVATEEVPVVNPDPSTEDALYPRPCV